MNQTKILIVEDELIPAANIARNLKKKGYTVMALAKSGEAALEQIAQEQPELILMDIHLQGRIDGIETVQEIRKKYQIPVIYLTAYSDKITLDRAKNTQPCGYLIKPFKTQQIYEMIESALPPQDLNSIVLRSSYSSTLSPHTSSMTD
ncbi:MAG: response regulator [Microcoleaceae cyanobacterium]